MSEKAVLLYKDQLYVFDGKRFDTIGIKEARKYPIGAVVPARFITTLTFKLPANISSEQLAIRVELKMYEEAGLDPQKEYSIDFIAYDLPQEDSILIEAFALGKEDADRLFLPVVSKIGFLDLLFPRFIAYESLYNEKFHPKENHLILYLDEEEAFGVVYQSGRYIGYRTIDSLMQISKKTGIEVARLKALLSQNGLVQSNYDPSQMHIFDQLQQIFYKNVEKLVYAINHKRSYFGLEGIDRVILDFKGGLIPGLMELFHSFGIALEAPYETLRCCGFDESQSTMAVEANYILHYESLPQRINLTFYERKKPWYRYELIKYAYIAAAALILVIGAWYYLEIERQNIQDELAIKERRLQKIRQIDKKLLKKLKEIQSEKSGLKKELASLENEIEIYEETLEAIPFIQKSKIRREEMMNDILQGLYTYRLSTRSIEQNGTKMAWVNLVSTSDQRDKIARFMRYLLDRNYRNVQTRRIESNDTLYQSTIRIAP